MSVKRTIEAIGKLTKAMEGLSEDERIKLYGTLKALTTDLGTQGKHIIAVEEVEEIDARKSGLWLIQVEGDIRSLLRLDDPGDVSDEEYFSRIQKNLEKIRDFFADYT